MENERAQLKRRLERALALDLPYPERPPKAEGTPASVLVLLGFDETGASLLLTRRTDQVEKHRGQMAFPGGMQEPGENDREAALRETHEEVGIEGAGVEIVGELPKLWTVTGFWVTPVVGMLSSPLGDVRLRLNPSEIADAFWIPLRTLQDGETYRREWIERLGVRFPIHAYYVGPDRRLRVWGATGAMIHNLLERLARVS